MKFTHTMMCDGLTAVNKMASRKAVKYYYDTDPLSVFEYDGEDGKLYAIYDVDGIQKGLTFKELEAEFEARYNELQGVI